MSTTPRRLHGPCSPDVEISRSARDVRKERERGVKCCTAWGQWAQFLSSNPRSSLLDMLEVWLWQLLMPICCCNMLLALYELHSFLLPLMSVTIMKHGVLGLFLIHERPETNGLPADVCIASSWVFPVLYSAMNGLLSQYFFIHQSAAVITHVCPYPGLHSSPQYSLWSLTCPCYWIGHKTLSMWNYICIHFRASLRPETMS